MKTEPTHPRQAEQDQAREHEKAHHDSSFLPSIGTDGSQVSAADHTASSFGHRSR